MRLKPLHSFRARLVIGVVLSTVPVILTAVLALGSLSASLAENSARQQLVANATSIAKATERWDHDFVLALENTRGQPDIIAMNPLEQRPVLVQMLKTYTQLEMVRVTRPDGITVVRTDGDTPVYYGDREWFKACMAGQPVARQLLITRTSNKPALNISTPIRDAKGNIVGVLSALNTLTSMSQMLGLAQGDAATQNFIVDEQGILVAHCPRR